MSTFSNREEKINLKEEILKRCRQRQSNIQNNTERGRLTKQQALEIVKDGISKNIFENCDSFQDCQKIVKKAEHYLSKFNAISINRDNINEIIDNLKDTISKLEKHKISDDIDKNNKKPRIESFLVDNEENNRYYIDHIIEKLKSQGLESMEVSGEDKLETEEMIDLIEKNQKDKQIEIIIDSIKKIKSELKNLNKKINNNCSCNVPEDTDISNIYFGD